MSSAAFYQILFQNDTLFSLDKSEVDAVIEKSADADIIAEKPTPPAQTAPAPLTPEPKVQTKPEPAVETSPAFPKLNHQVLILTDDKKNRELADSEALLLDNILKAVGTSAASADILNFSFLQESDARTVLSEKRTNYLITFGVPLIKLQLDLLLAPYTPKLVEGIWFLLADPLSVVDADKAVKKKLWLALQKMFERA